MSSPLRWFAIATVTCCAALGCDPEKTSHANLAYPAGPDTHARAERGAAVLGCRASTGLDGRVTTVTCGDEAVVIYDELRDDGRWYVGAHCDATGAECRDFARRVLDAGATTTPQPQSGATPQGMGGGPR